MSATARTIVLAVALTAIVAALAGYGGVQYGLSRAEPRPRLDELVHNDLQLTTAQLRSIDVLEADFAKRRREPEGEMRAANRELASAIETDRIYSERARAAVERFHHAMERLQELTIRHVLAMRSVLTPSQVTKFDETVHKSLTEDQP